MRTKLFRHSTVIFAGILAGNVSSYLLQIALGRTLDVVAYGEFNTLMSMFVIISVPFSTIEQYVSRQIAQFQALDQQLKVNQVIRSSTFFMLAAMTLLVLGAALGVDFVVSQLKLSSAISYFCMLFALWANTLTPLTTAIYQGLQRFEGMALNFALMGVSKLVFAIGFTWIGYSVGGALSGLGVGTLTVAFFAFSRIWPRFKLGFESIQQSVWAQASRMVPFLIANTLFLLMSQTDIILVKRLFAPHAVGLYSAASVLGKIILYLPGSIIMSLFPKVAAAASKSENSLVLLLQSLGLTLAVTVAAASGLSLTAWFFVPLLFGEKYLAAVPLVQLYAWVAIPLALLMMLMNYNLARGWYPFLYAFAGFLCLQFSGVWLFHDSISEVLWVLLTCSSAAVFVTTVWTIVSHPNRHQQTDQTDT